MHLLISLILFIHQLLFNEWHFERILEVFFKSDGLNPHCLLWVCIYRSYAAAIAYWHDSFSFMRLIYNKIRIKISHTNQFFGNKQNMTFFSAIWQFVHSISVHIMSWTWRGVENDFLFKGSCESGKSNLAKTTGAWSGRGLYPECREKPGVRPDWLDGK